jgi:hypothetical protein
MSDPLTARLGSWVAVALAFVALILVTIHVMNLEAVQEAFGASASDSRSGVRGTVMRDLGQSLVCSTSLAQTHKLCGVNTLGDAMLDGKACVALGANVPDKQVDAGKICYQKWSDGVDIVGAGTTNDSRKVKVWDRLQVGDTMMVSNHGGHYVRLAGPAGLGGQTADALSLAMPTHPGYWAPDSQKGDAVLRVEDDTKAVRIRVGHATPNGLVIKKDSTTVQGSMAVLGSVTTHQVRTTDVVVQPAGVSVGASSRILMSSSGPQDGSPNTLSVGMAGSGRFGGNHALFETTKSGVAGTADMVFKTNGNEVMRIDNRNNVIVQGSVKAGLALCIDGVCLTKQDILNIKNGK